MSQVTQINGLKLETQELVALIERKNKKIRILLVREDKAQAAVRRLISEIPEAQEGHMSHSACQEKILRLLEKLKQTQGVAVARHH